MTIVEVDFDVFFLEADIPHSVALIGIERDLLNQAGNGRTGSVGAPAKSARNQERKDVFHVTSLRGKLTPGQCSSAHSSRIVAHF